jgi:hypothetical protein
MFFPIPFRVVSVFQCFLGLDVEWAPTIVEMLQDLEGVDVSIRGEPVLELRVVLFVKGIALVVDNASNETLEDEPRCANEVPVFLFALALVGERGVHDGRIVRRRFVGDGVYGDGGEFVVLIGTKDVTKQTIVVGSVL